MRFTTNLKLSLVGLVIAAASFVGINAILSDADATSRDDCTANAVIKCGVDSVADMRDAYNTNRTKDIKGIYGHSFFGLSSDVVNNYTVKTGSVKRNGNVYVGDKLVATGAYSAGRDYYSGSTKRTTANGTTFYTRSVGTWQQASWDVYVFLDKSGRFVGAVMKSCGNPVTGKPTQPKPVYKCVSLSRINKDRTTWTFRGKAQEKHGASLAGFTFNYGDGTSKYVKYTGHDSDDGSYKYVDSTKSYTKAGTYTVKITAHFTVNGTTKKVTSADCQKPVTVEPKPEPKMVEVCDLDDMTVKEITEDEYNDNRERYTTDLSKCEKEPEPEMVEVCDLDDKTVKEVTREELEANPERYTEDLTKCEDEPEPEMVEVCDLDDKTVKEVTREQLEANPERYTEDLAKCEKEPEPEMVEVCDLDDYSITEVTREELEANPERYTTDLEKCDDVEVCDPETGEIVEVKPNEADEYEPVDSDSCKEQPPVEQEVTRCDPETGDIVTVKESEADEYLAKDADECKDEPEVRGEVTELPQTGIASTLSGLFGLGAMTTAGYYWLVSRRS